MTSFTPLNPTPFLAELTGSAVVVRLKWNNMEYKVSRDGVFFPHAAGQRPSRAPRLLRPGWPHARMDEMCHYVSLRVHAGALGRWTSCWRGSFWLQQFASQRAHAVRSTVHVRVFCTFDRTHGRRRARLNAGRAQEHR